MSEEVKVTDIKPTASFYTCWCGCKAPADKLTVEVDGLVVNFATKACHVRYVADREWR